MSKINLTIECGTEDPIIMEYDKGKPVQKLKESLRGDKPFSALNRTLALNDIKVFKKGEEDAAQEWKNIKTLDADVTLVIKVPELQGNLTRKLLRIVCMERNISDTFE